MKEMLRIITLATFMFLAITAIAAPAQAANLERVTFYVA